MTEETKAPPKQKDIYEVLELKLRELRTVQQHIACLKIVLPLLAEEGDQPRGWL